MRSTPSLPAAGTWLSLAAGLLSACGTGGSDAREIVHARTLPAAEADVSWNASAERRFGMSRTPSDAAAGGGLHWDTPAGWIELPSSSLRLANFQVAGKESTECYLTVLGGDGGGLVANLDRWRSQMGREPLTREELDALERAPFFGSDGVLIDFEGTWGGMSGDQQGDGYRLLGLAQITDGQARFLKMVGPSAVVTAERDAFLALAASFHADDGTHTHAESGASDAPAASAAPSSPLRWSAPDGWQRGPQRSMREVTYFAGPNGEAECYVSILGGDGGGLQANVDRWCDQMGAPLQTAAELAARPRVPMLGTEAVLVEAAGRYTGMGDADVPEALLYGAVCLLPNSSVFVKMIGPREVMEAERDAFAAFCESLELAQ